MGKSSKKRRRSRSRSRDSLDEMRKRIKKLEKQVARQRSRSREGERQRQTGSVSSRRSRSVSQASFTPPPYRSVSRERSISHADPRARRRDADHTPRELAMTPTDRSPRGATRRSRSADTDDAISILNEDDKLLTDDLDNFLGGKLPNNDELGNSIHDTLASRWSHIILNGLPAESEIQISNVYKIPTNCPCLKPPQINSEIIAVLTSSQSGRDKYYLDMQGQLGRGLSALAVSISDVQENVENIPKSLRDKLLSSLCDSGRLLCNLFNKITNSRRALVLPLLNKNLKEVIDKSPPSDKYIFGADLNERIKEAKNLENTAKELKNKFKPQPQSSQTPRTAEKRGGGHSGGQYRSRPLNRYRPIRQQREVRSTRARASKENHQERSYKRRHY